MPIDELIVPGGVDCAGVVDEVGCPAVGTGLIDEVGCPVTGVPPFDDEVGCPDGATAELEDDCGCPTAVAAVLDNGGPVDEWEDEEDGTAAGVEAVAEMGLELTIAGFIATRSPQIIMSR